MDLTITALAAAALALLAAILAIDTIRRRFKARVPFGTAEDRGLLSASRAHGNLIENAPLALILIGLLEAGGADRQILAIVAAAFVAGRVLHAIGLYAQASGPPPWPRSVGVITTLLTLLGLAGWLAIRTLCP